MLSPFPSTEVRPIPGQNMAVSQSNDKTMQVGEAADSTRQLSQGFTLEGVETTPRVSVTHRPTIVDSQSSEYESTGFFHHLLGGSPSWLTSMIIHLVVLLTLALWTVNATRKAVVSLEMDANNYSLLTELEDLDFDTVELQTESDSESMPETHEDVLSEFQPELQLNEMADAPLQIEDPLGGDASQLARLTQELNSRELELGAGESSFFGIETTGQSVVYIVDRSGSMGGQRWEDATGELLKSVRSLKSDQKFFVYLFSDACHPMPQLAGRNKLVPASEENKKAFEKWLTSQQPDETTKPLSSVRRALNMRPDTIFLLTDGEFYDNTGPYLIRLAELQKKRTNEGEQVINTIAFYCNFKLEMMLQEIASVHNGTFRSVQ